MPLRVEGRDHCRSGRSLTAENSVDDGLAVYRPLKRLAKRGILQERVAITDRGPVLEGRAGIEGDLAVTGWARRDCGDLRYPLKGLVDPEIQTVREVDLPGLEGLTQRISIIEDSEDDLVDRTLPAVPVGIGHQANELAGLALDHDVGA